MPKPVECGDCGKYFNLKFGGRVENSVPTCGECIASLIVTKTLQPKQDLKSELVGEPDFYGVCPKCDLETVAYEKYDTDRGWYFSHKHVGERSYCLLS